MGVIVASIRKHGFYGSVVAQKSRMRIVAGEHRWRGAAKAGLKHVPTVIIDVDDETAPRIMLADNRLAEYGQYDDAKLAGLLQSLPDLDGTGWRDEDLDAQNIRESGWSTYFGHAGLCSGHPEVDHPGGVHEEDDHPPQAHAAPDVQCSPALDRVVLVGAETAGALGCPPLRSPVRP
ncbi:ParB N-terminal domain-containing protein [Nonomuraea sp. MG754425]|uniref:ParB/RepB/Spo0J family partition protein n=1 Tax=Nonomuraea sp. MG754425 TaxID=2570319 RepID=UPI001F266E05|nr:ParB N-terminal domain-containing protein [Nonomuraea sp. MG754425]